MKLHSNLSVLLDLNLKELLAVQRDVTYLIETKVHKLQNILDEKEGNGAILHASQDLNDSDNKENLRVDENINGDADICDSDDYILTQFDHRTREKLLRQNTNESNIFGLTAENLPKKADLSSPLKDSQALTDSVGSFEEETNDAIGKSVVASKKVLSPSSDYKNRHKILKIESLNKGKTRLEPPHTSSERLSFNLNPLSKRPWILEDFRRNENEISMKRGRKKLKSLKLRKFYADGGLPPNGNEIENTACMWSDGNGYEFDNFRDRSKSPPGYGRLDFPTTQERHDDKKKSQEIIFQKTRSRFLQATCNTIPPQERAYIFKSEQLNHLVDEGAFEWNEKELNIFTRK